MVRIWCCMFLFFFSWINIRKYLLICIHIGMRSSELLSCALYFVDVTLKLSLNTDLVSKMGAVEK